MTTGRETTALDDYRWLLGAEAERVLQDTAADDRSALALAKKLRGAISPARARLVLEQLDLRRRARAKFSQADQMLFERKALEQATDQWIAAYKSARFPHGQPVADLCCGLGGDFLALARANNVVAVDREPVKAMLASENARRLLGDTQASVVSGDIAAVDVGTVAAWHIDPDRRAKTGRTSRIECYEPNLETIEKLLQMNRQAAIKLAPAASVPPSWAGTAELEWISRGGECRQQVAWFGGLARRPGSRTATMIAADGESFYSVSGRADVPVPTGPIARYIYEPDPAILAARLVGHVAQGWDLAQIEPSIPYLTGDRLIDDRGLAGFEVLEVVPFRLNRLKALLRDRGIGQLEVKKRGVDLDPEKLRSALRSPGSVAATLIVTRQRGRAVAIVAQRLSERC